MFRVDHSHVLLWLSFIAHTHRHCGPLYFALTAGFRAEPVGFAKQHALVAGSWDTLISVWFLRPYYRSRDAAILGAAPSHYLHGHDSNVCAVATSGHLRAVVSAGASGAILLHHLASGALLQEFRGQKGPAALLCISPLQPAVVAYVHGEKRLYAWHIQVQLPTCGCGSLCVHGFAGSSGALTLSRPHRVTFVVCARVGC